MKKILLIFLLSFIVLSVKAQVSSDLMQKAKQAGVSQAQIDAALKQQNASVAKNGDIKLIDEESRLRENVLVQDSLVEEFIVDATTTVFGREIFSNKNLTFAPNVNIPTPRDYVLGAGDEVKIDIWGNSELDATIKISPDGRINLSDLGPVLLSGLTVSEAEKKLKSVLSQRFIGLNDGSSQLSLTLGQIRSIKVNIVGEAMTPGTYTISSLSTLFNALYVAGGVNDIGSLRSIKVYRNNKLKSELDVYDYLLNGVSETNIRLEDGDMIMIPPYKSLIETDGEVKRNLIYELKDGETLGDLLAMSGGLKGNAYKESVKVERKNGDAYSINNVMSDDFGSFVMIDGDVVTVKGIADRYDNKLTIIGAVWYPGDYELNDRVNSVKTLIAEADGLKGDEFLGRAQIIRVNPDFTKSVIALDIKGIMNGTSPDVELLKDDQLRIPSKFNLREKYTVKVTGAVNNPVSNLDYYSNMSVEDAIILAGGLKESAATINVDISRRVKNPTSADAPNQIVEVFNVTLQDGLAIDNSGKIITLEPFDEVYVRYSPGYRAQEVVSVGGEVLFKGDYVLKGVNSRLSDVIRDAGGISKEAYVKGASLIRLMSDDEKNKVKTILALNRSAESKDSIVINPNMLESYSVGIDLEAALNNPGGLDDMVLKDGDVIFIPKHQGTVKISGSVVYPNSVTFSRKMSAKRYLDLAGGYSDYAKKRPIVIYMNGKVASTKKVALFFKKYPKVEPGCEILVPAKRQRNRASMAEIMSVASSTASMAAMVTSLITSLK